ncbi:PREDICTED: uncharacterized protein LOC104715847 isoform X2 [Camelina sativa]|uniref:Uncharacterized protein LOC104715847 isoform X2 n=1 Tax=Camelina sativa TaxID=90675 RepID=A0ABM1QG48_CAMSA|nr:PREDICTED: uncharacterized protein LOC104715847 isoform X2 [Camelina sativa]
MSYFPDCLSSPPAYRRFRSPQFLNKEAQIQTSTPRNSKFCTGCWDSVVRNISTLQARKQPNSYRLSDHAYKILLNDHTSMDVLDPDEYSIPLEYFCTRNYKDIQSLVGKGEMLPDIVAQVSCIQNADKVDETTTPPKTTSNLILTCVFDSGDTAYVSVWDNQASKVREDVALLKEEPIVVIVTGVNPKNLRGDLYLNATASTRFFWNVENNITEEFRKSPCYQKDLIPTIENPAPMSAPGDVQSISEILAYVDEQSGKEKLFWCKAKVVDLILSSGWFFISCTTCFKKMETSGDTLICGGACDSDTAIGRLRYRIEVVVDDECQTSTFVLFDEPAKKLFKSSASTLAAKNNVAQNDACGLIVPKEIQNLVGRNFVFCIKVREYNFTAKYQSFAVAQIEIPPAVAVKKRPAPPGSSKGKASDLVPCNPKGEKASDVSQQSKKHRPLRKNKNKVIGDTDDDTVSSRQSDPTLEDDV